MRLPILAAAAAVTLGACQPAAEPQPVDAEPTPDASAMAPMEAVPAATPEATPPQAATPALAWLVGPARSHKPGSEASARGAPPSGTAVGQRSLLFFHDVLCLLVL